MRHVSGWPTELYIDGAWRAASDGGRLQVLNPADGSLVGEVAEATVGDVESAIIAARRAFDEGPWAHLPVLERQQVLRAFADGLEAREAAFTELVVAEAGVTLQLARAAQVRAPLLHFRDMVERVLPTFAFSRPQPPTFGLGIGQGVVLREPAGVVSAITAFNWPMFLNISKIAPALAAGCTVVLRPSPLTPLSALLLGEVAEEAGLPAGVLNIVTGGVDAAALLTHHPAVDVVSFTGSDAVGRQVMQQAAVGAKRTVLELGGKSANIVLDDADLARVAPYAVTNFTRHSGQGCACFTRVLVHESRHDELVERMLEVLRGLKVGDPTDPATDMGPLISARQRDRVESYVALGREEGATVAFGGGRPAGLDAGFFVEPVLFTDVKNSMRIAQEEIFGPVGVVIPFSSDDEAVSIANDSPFGLSGAVWAKDPVRAYGVATRLRTGMVTLNGGGGGVNPHGPFGGYKISGVGREFGEAGLEEYLETKTVNWAVASG
ncbi:MAG: putative aldehyde dehydrogenase [Frankiales bacterium]|nr:putative aldehyde dehydrogenase [Frankiales bacterium]